MSATNETFSHNNVNKRSLFTINLINCTIYLISCLLIIDRLQDLDESMRSSNQRTRTSSFQ